MPDSVKATREGVIQPRVTVITATFNAAATLEACLESVRLQSYSGVDHLVIDGASTDGTVPMLERAERPGLRWISEPDRGIYDAWNKGLHLTRGEWIAFVGADDVLLPDAVAAYMELAAERPEAMYLSSRVQWIGAGGRARIIGDRWSWPRFQRYMCTAHVGSMHHRRLFEQYGAYDSSLRIVADYELLLRAGKNLPTAFLPQVTVRMQGGGTSDSLKALDESAQVKVATGKRHPWRAAMERQAARQMFRVRRMTPWLP